MYNLIPLGHNNNDDNYGSAIRKYIMYIFISFIPHIPDPTTITTDTFAGFEKTATTSTTIINKQSICQCTVTSITTGVISVIITALILASISFAIQISIYQCFYKPRLRSSSATTVTVTGGDHSQREGVTGSGDAIVYKVVDERVGTTLEMKENEAYNVNKRVGGLEMKQNEAYGVTRSA